MASERPAGPAVRRAQESHLARTDLGDKQVCPNCGAKFYDLRKRPAMCPKCATAFDPAEEGVRSRRRSRVSANDLYKDDEEEVEAEDKAAAEDGDEEEAAEETAEVDSEAAAEPLSDDEDEESAAPSGEELPEGFSEEEADLGEDAADDDSVPLLEDEEEFPEDEIGELPGEGDDDGER